MNTPNTPIDPADVLKNPEDYLLDGEPIDHIFLYIANASVGAWSQDFEFQKRVTRRPRTRTVRARRYWTADRKLYEWNETQITTLRVIEDRIINQGYKWAGPEFDVTVEE